MVVVMEVCARIWTLHAIVTKLPTIHAIGCVSSYYDFMLAKGLCRVPCSGSI